MSRDQISIQAVLSNCHLYGVGVAAVDLPAALLLAQESTASNNANGAVRLGYLLQYGKGTPKDLSAAAKYYKMAADVGHAEGLYRLATITHTGDGVAADVVRCLNFTSAFQFCSVSPSFTCTVTKRDALSRAAELCTRAAERGHAAAQ